MKRNKLLFISFVVIITIAFIWYVVLKQDFGNLLVVIGMSKINLSFTANSIASIYSVTYSSGVFSVPAVVTLATGATSVALDHISNDGRGYLLVGGNWYTGGNIFLKESGPKNVYGYGTPLGATFSANYWTFIPGGSDQFNTEPSALTTVNYVHDYTAVNGPVDNMYGRISKIENFTLVPGVSPKRFVIDPLNKTGTISTNKSSFLNTSRSPVATNYYTTQVAIANPNSPPSQANGVIYTLSMTNSHSITGTVSNISYVADNTIPVTANAQVLTVGTTLTDIYLVSMSTIINQYGTSEIKIKFDVSTVTIPAGQVYYIQTANVIQVDGTTMIGNTGIKNVYKESQLIGNMGQNLSDN